MDIYNLKKYELLSILLIIIAEILLFSGQRLGSIVAHSLNIILIIISIISKKRGGIIQSLSLVSLLRIINLSLPLFSFTLYWMASIYLIMLIPIVLLIKGERFSMKYIGLTTKNLYILPGSVLLGTGLALIEFNILVPQPLISGPSLSELVKLSIIMIFFIGLIEELIFRSLIQQSIEQISGPTNGLLLTSVIFGFMNSGYSNYNEILFACLAGILLGFSFRRTKSLPFVVLAHGVNNIILFGVLPFIF